MKMFRSILAARSRAMLCFLVGVCVSPVLIQLNQASMLGAKANEHGVFVQEPTGGNAPNAKQTLPTLPAGETSPPNDEKEVTDATIPSDPKEIVRLFLDSMRKKRPKQNESTAFLRSEGRVETQANRDWANRLSESNLPSP